MIKIVAVYKAQDFRKVVRVECTRDWTTDALISHICGSLRVEEKEVVVRIVVDSQTQVRVIAGWGLAHYPIIDGTVVHLTPFAAGSAKNSNVSTNSLAPESMARTSTFNMNTKCPYCAEYESINPETLLLSFCKACQNGEFEAIKKQLEECPENCESQSLRRQFLLHELSSEGLSSIHCAILSGSWECLGYLLDQGVDPNQLTDQGWLPLQLAVKSAQPKLVKLLLSRPSVQINGVTWSGSALHTAAARGSYEMLYILLEAGVDPSILDGNGQKASGIAKDPKCLQLLNWKQSNRRSLEETSKCSLPLVRGNLFYVSKIVHALTQVHLVLDPSLFCLFVYDIKQSDNTTEYKLKQQIPLKTVLKSDFVKERKWYMKKELIYFKLKCSFDNRILFACNYEQIAVKWVNSLKATCAQLRSTIRCKNSLNTLILDQKRNKITLMEAPIQQIPIPKQIDRSKYEIPKKKMSIVDFKLTKILGKGAFGKVFLAHHRQQPEQKFAIKVLEKLKLERQRQLKYAISQVSILKTIQNPFIVQLFYSFQTMQHLYVVLEYCPCGDLYQYLSQHGSLSEPEARIVLAQLILALEYLHDRGIIYRDLKPQNILIDAQGYIKLTDFGLSKNLDSSDPASQTFCGTPVYLSPEMLTKKQFTPASDIYGVGCILYEMIEGQPPYYSSSMDDLYRKIRAGNYSHKFKFSDQITDLISKLLVTNPEKRISIKEIKTHPFFDGLDWVKIMQKEYISLQTKNKLKNSNDGGLDDQSDASSSQDENILRKYIEAGNKFGKRVQGFTYAQ